MVGILVSFWDGLFSGAMLVSGRVMADLDSQGIGKKIYRPSHGPIGGKGHISGRFFGHW